jgi:5-methylcytosine-specific restriction endonuclease McrA
MAEIFKQFCECDCGKEIIKQPHHKRYGIPHFVRGHNSKDKNNPFYGKKHTEETRLKMIGKKHPIPTNGFKKGHIAWNKGLTISEEIREKIIEAAKNRNISEKTRKKMADSHRGDKTNFWKGGIDKKEYKHYRNLNYRLWREKVFKRDNYTCQDCGLHSGNGKAMFLIPHHIKSYTYYPELRYEVSNGKTLCKDCHNKLHWKNYKSEVSHRTD